MNAAFFEEREFDVETDLDTFGKIQPQEKFRMARRPNMESFKRPQRYNGIHRRRRKKIRL